MKYSIYMFLGCCLHILASCKTSKQNITYPDFIAKEIKKIEKEPPTNPPIKIYSYIFQNRTVYYFTPYCCDVPSKLYDDNGEMICQPDGGITGNGDMKCLDFFRNASNKVLVWEDVRGASAIE